MSERLSGLLGWVGIALVVGALLVRFAMPAQQEVWWWSAVAGIVVIGLYALTQWRDIVGSFSRRQTRYGALATSSVVLALGILVAINFVLLRQKPALGSNGRWSILAVRSNRPDSGVARGPNPRHRVRSRCGVSGLSRSPGGV